MSDKNYTRLSVTGYPLPMSTPQHITAVAFDWGGIFTEGTFDSSAVHTLAERTGVSETEVAKVYYPLMEHFEVGAFDFSEFHRRLTEGAGMDLDEATFREHFLDSVVERTAMYDVLNAIPQGYTVGMLSNNVPVLCDTVRDDPRMDRFEHFVFSNEIGVRKPDAEAFAKLTEALGHTPGNTMFIDDNEDNIQACRALGFEGVWLDSYEGFLTRFRELLPDIPLPTAT